MEELKTEATELGLDFKGNISKADLTTLVNEAKQLANGSSEKETESKIDGMKTKIKVKITPRDGEEFEGYVGLNGYTAQYKFDEEIEMPIDVVDFLKSKGGKVHNPKTGESKWQSRFLIEYV